MELSSCILQKLRDAAFDWATKSVDQSKANLASSVIELQSALEEHLKWVANWSREVEFSPFAFLKDPKLTSTVFTPLDVFVQPRQFGLRPSIQPELQSMESTIISPPLRHVVLLGQPGAGKTTSLKYFCLKILACSPLLAGAIDFPVVIRLRDLNTDANRPVDGFSANDTLLGRLQELLGIRISFSPELLGDDFSSERSSIRNRLLVDQLNGLKALLLIDGLDELAPVFRERIVREIRNLMLSLTNSLIILTSRTGEFSYFFESASHYEISPLSRSQISTFAQGWLGPEDGAALIQQIEASPFADTAIRPLILALLCGIYERYREVPDKPKTVYRMVVDLLIEKWDMQHSVRRKSRYARFDGYRKSEFLSHLAFVLTARGKNTVFTTDDLMSAYAGIHDNFGLPEGEAEIVVSEIETHTGLLLRVGYDAYEFSHKSLQEYLTAEHIVKLASIPGDIDLLFGMPNELAVATALSSQPSEYLDQLLHKLTQGDITFVVLKTFVSRLLSERIDFERTSRAAVALLAFYTKLIDLSISTVGSPDAGAGQEFAFVRDLLSVERLVHERISALIVQNLYSGPALRMSRIGDRQVMLLQRSERRLGKEHYSEVERLMLERLPRNMYVFASFLNR